jgi:TolB protein
VVAVGHPVAFTSDRSGSPQIYIVGVDGLNLHARRRSRTATSRRGRRQPFNEIAYASRTGPGSTSRCSIWPRGQTRQLTFGEGSNESPRFAPNGRHLVFTSDASGKTQSSRSRATARTCAS